MNLMKRWRASVDDARAAGDRAADRVRSRIAGQRAKRTDRQ
jgi:hypothetical protein